MRGIRVFTRSTWVPVLLAILVFGAVPAFAQTGGTTSRMSGIVTDAQGGVIPGANVVAKHNATAVTREAISDESGRFTIAGVSPGVYTVTVSLAGFKTFVAPDVQVETATPASVKVTLQIGELSETVVVTGAAEIVQTQSATVSTTIAVKQIQQLPVITHTALDYVVSLPGVETVGSNTRGSTVNGLPTTAINITLDGINVQDKRGSEGFFMYIRPMMDSVEEINVSTSTPGAEASGSGGANISMQTRSGSNRFSGSAYNTWRNQAGTSAEDAVTRTKHPGFLWGMNSPYWFNKRDIPKTKAGDYFINDTRLQTPGFRVGGPIVKDKLFYFFNYEEFRLPESRSRTRYLLNENARSGVFTYTDNAGATRSVNLLSIASANGQTATMDPSISKLLGEIRASTTKTGAVGTYDNNLDQYDFVPSATQKRKFPTVRADYNLSASHRLTFNYRYNDFNSTPDFLNSAEARWPDFPNLAGQVSGRWMYQASLRSTFSKNIVNEFRVGQTDATGLGTYFGLGVDESQFNCTGIGCQAAGGRGWNFVFPALTQTLTGATAYNGPSSSVAAQKSVENTTTWLKGAHSVSFGGSWARITSRSWNATPTYANLAFGTSSLDTTAYNMLGEVTGAANYPGGINATQAGYARTLYGLLTGRVTAFTGTAYLQSDGTYKYMGDRTGGVIADDFGFFASDSWRAKPNLTLTGGLRWQFQLPMTTTLAYSRPQTWQMVYGLTGAGSGKFGQGNLYHPGTLTGVVPAVVAYENSKPAYNTDWNNLAPSVGVTWRPNIGKSFFSKILSQDPVFRGGYSITYSKLGTSFFDSNYSGNPGRSRAASRSATTGTPVLGSDGWPVLLRDAATRLTPSAFPASVTYPLTPAINETLDIHYPDWPVTSTHQYSFGWQRELGKSMALDVRYVGNTNVGGWTTWNMNSTAQWSMLKGENGFYDEFRLAQQNLRANIAAGRGNTFAYTGVAGTSPLPIFQAYFAGTPLANAANQNPANYTSSNYTTSTWYNQLNMYSPTMTTMAGTGTSGLSNSIGSGTGLDANRVAAGLPINFFIPNPSVAQGNAYLETTAGNTRFNALQVELRRRMSSGLLVQGSYAYSFGRKTWAQRSLREDWFYVPSTGGNDHTFKANWVYELPFGQGKKFGSGTGGGMNRVIGGWEVDGVVRWQSGPKFNYGGYRLVGMTDKDLQKMFKFYKVTDPAVKDANGAAMTRIYMFPQDVITNSILALSTTSATTTTGYAGALPTGRYLAPASGPDCVQYYAGQCPGTAVTRIITGPGYFKTDLSIVKRIPIKKSMFVEARMDLFNIFDTINFTPTSATGSAITNWQVTAGAQDVNASQDPGGRITQFGLRFSW
jgi:hypothetical protein